MILAFILIFLQTASAAGQSTYNEFKGASKIKYINSEIIVKDKRVMMNSYVHDGILLSKIYFDKSVYVATKISLDHIRNNYYTSCDTNARLDVIQISFEDMNTPGLVTGKGEVLGSLWGFFDPGTYGDKYTILVASHTLNSTHTVIAHEVAHYWFERLCVYDERRTSSEEFARIVEDKYVDYFNSDQTE
jgi:hypothetical protein